MDQETEKKVVARLRRIAGQVQGVTRMVEGDRACPEILPQIASAQAALSQVSRLLVRGYVERGLRAAMTTKQSRERQRQLDELIGVLSRYGDSGRTDRAPSSTSGCEEHPKDHVDRQRRRHS